MEIVLLLIVLACVVGVMFLLLGGLRPSTASPKLRDYTTPDGPPIGWITPFVTMLAAASILELSGAESSGSASIGAGFGLLAFLCTVGGTGVRWVVDLAGSVIGTIATVQVGAAYVSGGSAFGAVCAPSSPTQRVVALVAMVGLFTFGLMFTLALRIAAVRKVGLAAFGAIELLVFLASPLGTEFTGWGAAVAVGAACLLGGLAGAYPDLVILFVAPALALTMIGATVTVGDACTLPGTSTGFVTFVGFAAVLAVAMVLSTPLRRR